MTDPARPEAWGCWPGAEDVGLVAAPTKRAAEPELEEQRL